MLKRWIGTAQPHTTLIILVINRNDRKSRVHSFLTDPPWLYSPSRYWYLYLNRVIGRQLKVKLRLWIFSRTTHSARHGPYPSCLGMNSSTNSQSRIPITLAYLLSARQVRSRWFPSCVPKAAECAASKPACDRSHRLRFA
jgi:hypothetical protein